MKAKKIVLGRNVFLTNGSQLDHTKIGEPLSHKQKKALKEFYKKCNASRIKTKDTETNKDVYITIEDFIFISDMEYREDINSFQQFIDSFNIISYA